MNNLVRRDLFQAILKRLNLASSSERNFLRQQEIHISSLIGDLQDLKERKLFDFLVANHKISSSRNLSDLVALFFLGSNKTFLELGAGDPIVGSDTYVLENSYGWTGVQVEPHPAHYGDLKKSRTNSHQVNAAIVADEKRLKSYLDLKSMSLINRKKRGSIPIRSMDLFRLVEETGISSYDALFIDIEGGESNIITSKIFSDFHFKFINIERIWNGAFLENRLKYYGYSQVGKSFSSYSGWFIKDEFVK